MRLIFTIVLIFPCLRFIHANTIVHTDDFNTCGSITWTPVVGSSDSFAANDWSCNTFSGRTYMELYDSDGINEEDWLVSPSFNLDMYSKEYFSFEYDNNTGMEGLTLLYSTDFSGTYNAANIDAATWTAIPLDLYNNDTDNAVDYFLFQRSLDLSGISGSSVYLAFRYISAGAGTQGWSIDDVRLTADYYAPIETAIAGGDKCYDLKQELYNHIKDHTVLEYTSSSTNDIWEAFYVTDRKLDNTGTNIIVNEMYSTDPTGAGNQFTFGVDQDIGDPALEGEKYNREHTFPKSWWGGSTAVDQYTDIHFVVPSDRVVNTAKWNYPLGENNGTSIIDPSAGFTSANGSKVGDCTHTGYSGLVFEPIDEYKGDFARMYLYFSTRYDNLIAGWESNYTDALDGIAYTAYEPWLLQTLLDWHEGDPVSQKEIDRNNAVYSIQKNRNPFIDHPEYVFYIWGSAAAVGCPTFLPVELTEFKGKALEDLQSEITWTTTSESNSSHFVLEHSRDGLNFKSIADVQAMGESLESVDYGFVHKSAVMGNNFYRLRIIDKDASEEYSDIITVSHDKKDWFNLYPTIVQSHVNIRLEGNSENATVRLFDLHGRMVKYWDIVNNNEFRLEMNGLGSGHYIIQIQKGSLLENKKIVLN